MTRHLPALLSALATAWLLVACGGGSDGAPAGPQAQAQDEQQEQYAALQAEAAAARADVVANAASGPCSSDDQCSTLTLHDYGPPCPFDTRIDYSLASPTASAASAAAQTYDRAASQAAALAPPSNVIAGCLQNDDASPLICRAGECQRGFRFGLSSGS